MKSIWRCQNADKWEEGEFSESALHATESMECSSWVEINWQRNSKEYVVLHTPNRTRNYYEAVLYLKVEWMFAYVHRGYAADKIKGRG